MSTVSDLIFNGEKHYITSKFGKRASFKTDAGVTSSFHSGTDYGTNGKKLAQYAIDIGTVISCGKASDGAKYVWVEYPIQGVKMLHYHLDSIKVKARQSVNKSTLLGYTGKTGKATGVHLHLGVKRLSGGDYIDPEKWSANEYKDSDVFFPARGYFKFGDKGENVRKINKFLHDAFPAYAKTLNRNKADLLGDVFGNNTLAWVKEFQRRRGLEVDGQIGPLTFAEMKECGFKI